VLYVLRVLDLVLNSGSSRKMRKHLYGVVS